MGYNTQGYELSNSDRFDCLMEKL